ncbi:MAG TPA: hypothetical protein PK566_13530 [Pseudobacteroides sp.]|nr:hypothetical protein [Pseudobacteroides sp.]
MKRIDDKKEIMAKLQELSNKPVPPNLSHGAMCYRVARPPERAEYICPVCHSKTIYTSQMSLFISFTLPGIRRIVRDINLIVNCNLDESEFCKKCFTGEKKPELCFIIRYKNNDIHKVFTNDYSDFLILKEFLEGKDVHDNGPDGETPLKDH